MLSFYCYRFRVAMAVATEKIYKCGHCGTTNDSLESLKQHMLSSHMAPQLHPTAAGDAQLSQQVVQQQVPQLGTQVVSQVVPQQVTSDIEQESNSLVVTQPKTIDAAQTSQSLMIPPVPPQPDVIRAKPPGKFKCGHCGIIVTTMDKLKSHMLTTHVNDQTGEYAGQRQQQVQQPVQAAQPQVLASPPVKGKRYTV